MNILINLVLFYLTLSNAASTDNCIADNTQALRKLSKPIGEEGGPASISSVGAEACGDLLDHYTELGAPWCACFKWPEAVDLVTNDNLTANEFYFNDCRLSTSEHANFPVSEAVEWCDEETPCTDVGAQSVCEAKNCIWDTDECTDANPTVDGMERKNHDSMVATSAINLTVPWIDGCDMLVAVYDQYHNRTCDDVVYELKQKMEENDMTDPNDVFQTTLREVCGETCWYQDQGAPYVFDRNHSCTSHAQCNGGDENVHDYFCADCAACMAENPDATDECGICRLTNYDTDVCIEMQQCTAYKSIDNQCASQTATLPEGATTGNEKCAAEDVYTNIRIDSCYHYFHNLDDDETIRVNACPCHLDPAFVDFTCAWDIQFLYTLNEIKNQCAMDCEDIMDRDACLSAHQNDEKTTCVWLNRLVKGKCVSDPCTDTFCEHDECVRCSTDAMGEQSCIVNPDVEGLACDDQDDETDNDVCSTDLYSKKSGPFEGKHFACKGVSAVAKVQEQKTLCVDATAWDECCVGGEEYRCDNNVLNYTLYKGGNCDNGTIATYYWNMDGSCSNVITTEARSRNIYFRGSCELVELTASVTNCSETEYWDWLESQTPDFVPFDDSASTLGILSIISLLFFFI